MNRFLLFSILLALGIVWGTTIPLTKIAVSTGHHPFVLIFWQSTMSAVILAIIMVFRRSRLVLDRSRILFFLVVALTGTLVPNTTSYLATFHLPAGVMALIIALVPMFSLLVALVFKLERFRFLRFGGVVLGALAISLIVLPDSSLPDPTKAVFVLLALVGPFCYGLEGNYLSVRQPRDTGPIATLFAGSVIGVLASFPLVLATGSFVSPLAGMGPPEWALVASTLMHIMAYAGYIWMVGKAGAVFASQVAYIVTPAGVLISMALLGEQHSAYIWIALLILLAGLALVQPRRDMVTVE